MTCKDCNYYKPINDNEGKCNSPIDAYYGFDTTVVGDLGKCEYFVSKDGTYHNGTEHCPRCGRPVPKWGLCDECSRIYDSWESVSK